MRTKSNGVRHVEEQNQTSDPPARQTVREIGQEKWGSEAARDLGTSAARCGYLLLHEGETHDTSREQTCGAGEQSGQWAESGSRAYGDPAQFQQC